jgi:hypothetical protein
VAGDSARLGGLVMVLSVMLATGSTALEARGHEVSAVVERGRVYRIGAAVGLLPIVLTSLLCRREGTRE